MPPPLALAALAVACLPALAQPDGGRRLTAGGADVHALAVLVATATGEQVVVSGEVTATFTGSVVESPTSPLLVELAAAAGVGLHRSGRWNLVVPKERAATVVMPSWVGAGWPRCSLSGLGGPRAAASSRRVGPVSIELHAASVVVILGFLGDRLDEPARLTVPAGLEREVTVRARDAPWAEVLGAVTAAEDLSADCIGADIRVASARSATPWSGPTGEPRIPESPGLIVEPSRQYLDPEAFRLVATIVGGDRPLGVLVDPHGIIYTLAPGAYVGPRWGTVSEIGVDHLVIREPALPEPPSPGREIVLRLDR